MVALVFLIFLIVFLGSLFYNMVHSLVHFEIFKVLGWTFMIFSNALFLAYPRKKKKF